METGNGNTCPSVLFAERPYDGMTLITHTFLAFDFQIQHIDIIYS